MVQFVCEGAEEYAVRMLEELHRMKQDEDHCDFVVQVGNDVYHAHKNVLSAGSDYFRAMLKYDTKESREGRVVFKDVDSECVKICIDFIYSSKYEIPDGKNIELLHVAAILQLERLRNAISNNLAESITIENYFSARNAGDIYGLDDVTFRCRTFLRENIMEIANHSGFGSVEKDDIFRVLKSSETTLWEEDKLELSLKWIETCEKKQGYLHEFLKLIDFDRISQEILQRLHETHTIIRNDSKSYKLISEHLHEASAEPVNKKELIILFDLDMDCMRSFNPNSEKITMFNNTKFRHLLHFTAIFLNSHIYVLCQDKSVHRLNLQRKNSEWEKMEDMICDHGQYPCSVVLRGSIYVVGSYRMHTNDVERFDPSINRWFQLPNKPTGISGASLVSLNDSIYSIGGIGGIEQYCVELSSFCRFNPSSSEWVDLDPMRYAAYDCGVVAVDPKIFVISGWSREKKTLNNVECYDVTSAQWTSLPSMNFDRGYDTAYHIGNWIFVVDGLGCYHDIVKYDLLNNKWCRIKREEDQDFAVSRSVLVKL